ncbi:MAG TPA: hypothetical protein VH877_01575 [Polyangia bacterium]|jgi:hypothetical protein|nr:hypothetical protein [Polyangia bacterium]
MNTLGLRTVGLLLSLCGVGCATAPSARNSPRLEPLPDEAAVQAAAAHMAASPNAPPANCENLGMVVGVESYFSQVDERHFAEAMKEAQLKAAQRGATYLQLQPALLSSRSIPQVVIVGTAFRCPSEANAPTTSSAPAAKELSAR